MAAEETPLSGTRQDRRKAATRAKIQAAAETLFGERGYEDTSIEDISVVADVAVRTIYTHFPSKAAIMLAYFDGWVDAFIDELLRRPLDEPVVEAMREALRAMGEAGWVDRVENEDSRVHPLVDHLEYGPPDIAGHVLQRWMGAMERIADDAARRGGHPADSLEPQARAVAVFAGWIAAMSVARGIEPGRKPPPHATGNSRGLDVLTLIMGGGL